MSTLEYIEDFVENYDGRWSEFEWAIRPAWNADAGEDYGVLIPGVGTAHYVASYGGEGLGEERWLVFEVAGVLYRKDAYYASYDGTTWDGEFYEVKPVEVVVTEYRSVR